MNKKKMLGIDKKILMKRLKKLEKKEKYSANKKNQN